MTVEPRHTEVAQDWVMWLTRAQLTERVATLLAEYDEESAKVQRIAEILNVLHRGDDGELTPGQARKAAVDAIREVLGVPF